MTNASTGMTDPTAQEELPPPPPAKPPRPTYPATSTTQKQLLDDELYARQLAEQYGGGSAHRGRPGPGWSDPSDENPEERERNFFDGLLLF